MPAFGTEGHVYVKVCGVTTVDDAVRVADAGADAIGLNFWPKSPRRTDAPTARAIVDAVGDRVECVAIFVDADEALVRDVRAQTGIRWAQLHGAESPAFVERLGPEAYKGVAVPDDAMLADALAFPGARLLVDAHVPGMPGGTGVHANWSLARRAAAARPVLLAGGLRSENVRAALDAVRPAGVDVASGVEIRPGIKDSAKVRAFVEAVRTWALPSGPRAR